MLSLKNNFKTKYWFLLYNDEKENDAGDEKNLVLLNFC